MIKRAAGLPQLRPFRVDLRDKATVKDLLYKLDIKLFGWNLLELCEEHFFAIPQSASLETHRNGLCVLISILVSADGERLLNHSDAIFDSNGISKKRFLEFVTKFAERLKDSLIDGSAQLRTEQGVLVYPRGIFDIMEGYLYKDILPRNPAIPVVTLFMIILLTDLYSLSIHDTLGATIASSLWVRVLVTGVSG
jgi:hypothetical protein